VGPKAEDVSKLWRAKQLEYTWTRTLMGRHADFWALTGEALDVALAAFGVAGGALRDSLLDAYRRLAAYPEVSEVLTRLRGAGLKTAILSNGTPVMLQDAVQAAGIASLLDAVLSVEEIGIYKPDARVYQIACRHFGVKPEAICFQSSNAWDAAGAAAFGFRVAWINRSGQPAEYAFAKPSIALPSLAKLPEYVLGG
jgi:2-haloacid dehalogenase